MAECCGHVATASYRVDLANPVTEASRGGGVACFGRCRACEFSEVITSAHGTMRKRAGVPSGCCRWAASAGSTERVGGVGRLPGSIPGRFICLSHKGGSTRCVACGVVCHHRRRSESLRGADLYGVTM